MVVVQSPVVSGSAAPCTAACRAPLSSLSLLKCVSIQPVMLSNLTSSSVIPFSFSLQSFSASVSLPMSRLFTSGGQKIAVSVLTIWTFVGKVMSLLSNMVSRFVIAFLPRSLCDSESEKISSLVLFNLFQSHGLQPVRLLYPWDSPGKKTGMISHSLFQRIFLTPGSNPGLPHCRQIFYDLSHQGSP